MLHRQVVRAKAEGLFFKVDQADFFGHCGILIQSLRTKVSTLDLFKTIHSDKSLSKEQPYKDLVALIKFILRKFFKAVEEDPFVVIQVRVARQCTHFITLLEQ